MLNSNRQTISSKLLVFIVIILIILIYIKYESNKEKVDQQLLKNVVEKPINQIEKELNQGLMSNEVLN